MPKYKVELREWVEYGTMVEIDADNPADARRLAREEADDWLRSDAVRDGVAIVRRQKT